jgi:hypothetical protein
MYELQFNGSSPIEKLPGAEPIVVGSPDIFCWELSGNKAANQIDAMTSHKGSKIGSPSRSWMPQLVHFFPAEGFEKIISLISFFHSGFWYGSNCL